MPRYDYRIVNVFAESTFGGNPLCVFEDARGMDEQTMQDLARQFNLSETTFILPSGVADAQVRIFTTGYEMRFAGHPTLGSAHVLRDLLSTVSGSELRDSVRLEFKAGVVAVRADGDVWTFTAPTDGMPKTRSTGLPPAMIAAMLGLDESDLLGDPMWVDTGTDQLLIPVKSAEAVRRATPAPNLLAQWPVSSLGRKTGYVFAFTDATDAMDVADATDVTNAANLGQTGVLARYFFTMQGGGVAEDPGTGSACANLGGWLLATGRELPARIQVSQGEFVNRPCRLLLEVNQSREILVGGRVVELGRGSVNI